LLSPSAKAVSYAWRASVQRSRFAWIVPSPVCGVKRAGSSLIDSW
jgi:hypothetical protein